MPGQEFFLVPPGLGVPKHEESSFGRERDTFPLSGRKQYGRIWGIWVFFIKNSSHSLNLEEPDFSDSSKHASANTCPHIKCRILKQILINGISKLLYASIDIPHFYFIMTRIAHYILPIHMHRPVFFVYFQA